MTRIELHLLERFATVAEELHFGRAAGRLQITQPSLSQQIALLEERVGCRLFARRPRVALTEAGQTLYRSATQVLRELRHGIEATRRVARGESGSVTVGLAGSVLVTAMARVVREFRELYPGVELRLQEMPTAAQVDALLSGAIDLGLGREAVDRDGLTLETIMREKFIVALPDTHPLARDTRIRIADLREEPFVLFPRWSTPVLYDRVVALCQTAGFAPRVVQEAVEWLNIVSLVATGIGLAIVPESFRAVQWNGVEYRDLSPGGKTTGIHLSYRAEPSSPAVVAFISLVRRSATTRVTKRNG